MKKILISALMISAATCFNASAQDTLPNMPKITIPNVPTPTAPALKKKTPVEINTELLVGTINANTGVTNFIPVKEAMGYLDDPSGAAIPSKAIGNGNLSVYSLLLPEMIVNLSGQRDAATAHALKIMASGFLPTKEDYQRILKFLPDKPNFGDYIMTTQFEGYIWMLTTLKNGKQTAVMNNALQALIAQPKWSQYFKRVDELGKATH
jgi:hypothetical protein